MIPGYTDFELIGEGGCGRVFRATAPDGHAVAVKVMRAELCRDARAVRRFKREADVLRALEHAAIPKVLDVTRTVDAQPAIVMEFVRGRDLRALIALGPSPRELVVAVGVGVARALDHAHSQAIVHRDVKPSNIMLTEGEPSPDRVRVLDFGIAFCVNETRITAASSLGADAYMAPEQRFRTVTPASDLYALGVTLGHVLTGVLPAGPGVRHALRPLPEAGSAMTGSVAEGRDGLDELICSMTAIDPVLRPASAREVEMRLLSLQRADAPTSSASAFQRLVEQHRAKELELRSERRELERLREDARESELAPEEDAMMRALDAGEADRTRSLQEITLRLSALARAFRRV